MNFPTSRLFFNVSRKFRNISTQAAEGPMYATVPFYRAYIFLHASQPPSQFPAKYSTPIQRELQLRTTKWGGFVNYSWSGQGSGSPDDGPSATAFSALGGRLEIPEITLKNIDEVDAILQRHSTGPLQPETSAEVHLYVCTHGARDCRCGEHGGAFVRALREEVEKRSQKLHQTSTPRFKISEVGHIGGHKYAANLLIYPHGEWLGLLKPEDASEVLDFILLNECKPMTANQQPSLLSHWRGRLGLSKQEQLDLHAAHSS